MGQPEQPSQFPTDDPPQEFRTRISSSDILGGRQQVEIDHAGEIYRLRLTKTGKLILTK